MTALVFCLMVNGRILDGHPWARVLEPLRLGLLAGSLPLLSAKFVPVFTAYIFISALLWWWLAITDKKDTVALASH